VINDPKVAKVFDFLINKNVGSFEPVFTPGRDAWASYPAVEPELGADAQDSAQLLEDLARLGYLTRRFHDRVQFCPACNSQDLKLVTFCPKCGSAHLLRQRLLEHKSCGYIGTEAEFTKSGPRVCPKCRGELGLIGSDYSTRGPRYHCGDCDSPVEQAGEKWVCRSCRRGFPKEEAREAVLYAYALDPAQVARLRVERIPKARVRESLLSGGYEIQEQVQETGRSGAVHRLDLLATKRTGPKERRVVVGFSSAAEAVDSEEVIKLYAKGHDVDAHDIIMVACPKLSDDARQFASHYSIRVLCPEDLDQPDLKLPS
jgi:hypothetical protein